MQASKDIYLLLEQESDKILMRPLSYRDVSHCTLVINPQPLSTENRNLLLNITGLKV